VTRRWASRPRAHTDWADLKVTYGSAEKVEKHVVFDIGGNKYRLIAMIRYAKRKLYIRHVLTHREYNRGKWKDD
jgi:mRNA interferase HigB